MDVADFDLGLSVTLWENLFETRLEDSDIVVDESLFLCWIVLAHDTHQCEIPVSSQRPPLN